MIGLISSLRNYRHAKLLVFLVFISTIIRYVVFKTYYVFSNDDLYYWDWVHALLNSESFDLEDSPVFPPGYPMILLFENWILGSAYVTKMFEQVILMTLIPVLIVIFLQKMQLNLDRLFLTSIFSVPFMFLGMSTINVSSEIWYTVIVFIGLLLIISADATSLVKNSISSSVLFSFAYLIRPEALVYFVSLALAIAFWASKYEMGLSELLRKFWILLIPPATAISGLGVFLTKYYGQFTLTGKFKMNYEISREISENIFLRIFENALGLIRVLVAPLFFGPGLVILGSLGLVFIILGKKKIDFNFMIIFVPSLLMSLILLLLYPMGRPLIPSIVVVIILGYFGWEGVKTFWPKGNGGVRRATFGVVLAIQAILPILGNQLADSTKGYYEALDQIDQKPGLLIYSRETTLPLLQKEFQYCNIQTPCKKSPDYLLLSDSTRSKLTPMDNLETLGKFPESIGIFGENYRKVRMSVGPYRPVHTYQLEK